MTAPSSPIPPSELDAWISYLSGPGSPTGICEVAHAPPGGQPPNVHFPRRSRSPSPESCSAVVRTPPVILHAGADTPHGDAAALPATVRLDEPVLPLLRLGRLASPLSRDQHEQLRHALTTVQRKELNYILTQGHYRLVFRFTSAAEEAEAEAEAQSDRILTLQCDTGGQVRRATVAMALKGRIPLSYQVLVEARFDPPLPTKLEVPTGMSWAHLRIGDLVTPSLCHSAYLELHHALSVDCSAMQDIQHFPAAVSGTPFMGTLRYAYAHPQSVLLKRTITLTLNAPGDVVISARIDDTSDPNARRIVGFALFTPDALPLAAAEPAVGGQSAAAAFVPPMGSYSTGSVSEAGSAGTPADGTKGRYLHPQFTRLLQKIIENESCNPVGDLVNAILKSQAELKLDSDAILKLTKAMEDAIGLPTVPSVNVRINNQFRNEKSATSSGEGGYNNLLFYECFTDVRKQIRVRDEAPCTSRIQIRTIVKDLFGALNTCALNVDARTCLRAMKACLDRRDGAEIQIDKTVVRLAETVPEMLLLNGMPLQPSAEEFFAQCNALPFSQSYTTFVSAHRLLRHAICPVTDFWSDFRPMYEKKFPELAARRTEFGKKWFANGHVVEELFFLCHENSDEESRFGYKQYKADPGKYRKSLDLIYEKSEYSKGRNILGQVLAAIENHLETVGKAKAKRIKLAHS